MIVVDTSAIVAIVFGEPERETFVRVLEKADRALISTVSVLEARIGRVRSSDIPRLHSIENSES